MSVSEQNRAKLNLLTTSEVADLLKLNQQVVLRKLSSGEIPGYKLGKEWRVSETQLMEYLESRSNTPNGTASNTKVYRNFFQNGRLSRIPASRAKRLEVLKYLVSKLDMDRVYSEKEINDFLREYHSDFCTLRREFIMNRLMVRERGRYKRMSWNTDGKAVAG